MTMHRRDFMKGVLGASVGVSLRAERADAEESRRRPNILFIMTDQHRLDVTGVYGNPVVQTPNLDRLAAEGMRFDNYYIAAFPCSPSRASLMTGLHPQSHGVIVNGVQLDPKLPTFARELGRAGYHTTWMGKWHLRGNRWFVRGEDGQLPHLKPYKPPPLDPKRARNGFQDGIHEGADYVAYLKKKGLNEPRPGKKVRGGHHSVIEDGHSVVPEEHFIETYLTDEAIAYLRRERSAGRPFCLGVSYEGPHRPITPPEPWDKMYDPKDVVLPPTIDDPMERAPESNREGRWRMRGIDLAKERARLKRQLVFEGEMWDLLDRPAWTEREYRELIAHYYGFVSYIDAQIGRLLNTLDELGLADDTLVIYTTDHGNFCGGHGCIFKAYMMYDDLMRVPLVVRMPGVVPKGRSTKALASSVDLMPTLVDFGSGRIPAGVQGKSLRPVLTGKAEKHHDAVFTSFATPHLQMRMVRTDRYKYCLNFWPPQIDQLYDMHADPNEMHNLIGKPELTNVEQRLRGRIYDFMKEIEDPWLGMARKAERMVPPTKIEFDFDEPYQELYWAGFRGISGKRVTGGKLVGEIDCPGFLVAKLTEAVAGDDYPLLEITMAASAGEMAQFYWATTDRPRMCERLSIRFPIRGDGKLHTYRLELGKHPEWKGKRVTSIRINPVRRTDTKKPLRAAWEIDRIGPPK